LGRRGLREARDLLWLGLLRALGLLLLAGVALKDLALPPRVRLRLDAATNSLSAAWVAANASASAAVARAAAALQAAVAWALAWAACCVMVAACA